MLITWVLTVLAAVVVVLTRVRLAKETATAAGRISIPKSCSTCTRSPACPRWCSGWRSWSPETTLLGWIGLLLWWVTVVAGLLVLARWMPAKGKHSSGPATDTWGEGPGLSVLAHVGLLVGVSIFTAFLALDKIA